MPPPPADLSTLEGKAVVLCLPASLPGEHEPTDNRKKEVLNNLRGVLVAKPTGLKHTAVSREMPFSLAR